MRRPAVTSWRKGRMSSGFSGPPNAIRSTESAALIAVPTVLSRLVRARALPAQRELVNHLHHGDHVLDGRLGKHAVAEVEDVAGPAGGPIQDRPDVPLDLGGPWGE